MTSKKLSKVAILLLALAPVAWGAGLPTRKLQGSSVVNGSGVLGINSSGTVTIPNSTGTVVVKDGSGNFSAGTITATLTGTASGNLQATPNQYGVVVSGSGNTATVIAPDASTTKVLTSGGTGANPSWQAVASAPQQSYEQSNVGFSAVVSSNTLVVGLTQSDGSTPPSTGSAAANVGFRSETTTVGGYSQVSFTAANSITLGTTDSLGLTASVSGTLYVYLISDTSSEICLSGALFDERQVQSASALTAGADTVLNILWCPSAHTSKPIRKIGRFNATWSNPNWSSVATAALTMGAPFKAPTIQRFTSGSSTYTTPAGVLYLDVLLVGAGGGGGGAGSSGGGSGGTGDSTVFGPLSAVGGGGGGSWANNNAGAGGTGGTCTGSTPIPGGSGIAGAFGNATTIEINGGAGGNSILGGGGSGGHEATASIAGATNSGGGGGGGGTVTANNGSGGGGGAGEGCRTIISAPASSYSVIVGAGGAAGINGTGAASAVAAGADGLVEVREHYQ